MKFAYLSKVLVFISFISMSSLTVAAESPKTLKSLKAIEGFAADWVGNGTVGLSSYDADDFSLGAELSRIQKRFKKWSGECQFIYVVGREKNLASMKTLELNTQDGNQNGVDTELAKLHRGEELNTILSAQWDGKTGDGVHCSVYYYEIYTVGGSVLTLDYQLTD